MKFLCWDTSTSTGVVALCEFNEDQFSMVGSKTPSLEARFSEQLLRTVDELLSENKMDLDDIEGIGVGLGPGSFTGLRIGITTARTLAQIRGLPIIGVSSLSLIVNSLKTSKEKLLLLENAYRGEFFTLRGTKEALTTYFGDPVNEVYEEVLQSDQIMKLLVDEDYELLGSGLSLFGQMTGYRVGECNVSKITPEALVRTIHLSFMKNHEREYSEVLPDYQRPSSAELNRQVQNKHVQ